MSIANKIGLCSGCNRIQLINKDGYCQQCGNALDDESDSTKESGNILPAHCR